MPDLTLYRKVTKGACYGMLCGPDGVPFAVTLELPWKENAKRVSAIPTGTYRCQRVKSPKFGDTFEVTGVPNRDAILFHGGNTVADSLGCILVGHGFDPVKGSHGIVQSQKEFAEFLAMQKGVTAFTLVIKDVG